MTHYSIFMDKLEKCMLDDNTSMRVVSQLNSHWDELIDD